MSAPLSLEEWWGRLPISRLSFSLPPSAEVTVTAGGEVTVSELGARLWVADIVLWARSAFEAPEIQSNLRRLLVPGASALVTPLPHTSPRLDRFGIVDASAVTIAGISADRHSVSLSGLPDGYTLSQGDYLSIDAGGAPHLHQLLGFATADAGGSTDMIGVVPQIRASVAPGAAVTLVNPTMKAVIDPSSVSEGQMTRARAEGISFRLVQTLRA